ncbi:MAG: flippase-like domain-containing protein [Deltaproteobacteria bacterium]|nr:flippase-like domain-containing protein [Deltaproteobacteria bacterium]
MNQGARSFALKLAPKLLISLVLGALFAWLANRGGVPLIPSAESFSSVRWWVVPVYTVSLLVTHFFRASRWRFLIAPVKRVPLGETIILNWIGFFAIFALPLRLGEIARPALTKMRQEISMSVGFGTVAVERVVDGLVTSACVVWALFAIPRLSPRDEITAHLPYYGYLSLLIFGVAFIVLAMFLWKRRTAVRLTKKTIGLVSSNLGSYVAGKVESVADGIRSLGDLKLGTAFLVETLLYWGTNIVGMWLLGLGCGLSLNIGHATAIMGILAIGILLPTGPGLFGNFQLAISTALKLYFADAVVGSQGAVYIFVMYAIQTVVIVLAGVIPLYVMNLRIQDLVAHPTL